MHLLLPVRLQPRLRGHLNDFIVSRRLDDGRERELFNGFARALLDSARNLALRFDLPERDWHERGLSRSFNEAWSRPAPDEEYKANFGDTLSLFQPTQRVRLRAEAAEPISGGRLWTFSNGIKVIFKKMDTPGEFQYALMLRSGVAECPGLQAGESAFVGDMLALSSVAGLSGADFHEMLLANGITMQEESTLSDLRITGLAPRAKLPLLLRALLSVADARQPSKTAFDYYKSAEALRVDMEQLSPRDVNSLMDSLMRPNYFYTDRKQTSRLRDDLPERAEQYFAAAFSKINDGILVLMGDLNEDQLKKELVRTLTIGHHSVDPLFSLLLELDLLDQPDEVRVRGVVLEHERHPAHGDEADERQDYAVFYKFYLELSYREEERYQGEDDHENVLDGSSLDGFDGIEVREHDEEHIVAGEEQNERLRVDREHRDDAYGPRCDDAPG